MALTPEWEHRIKLWENALWESVYEPLNNVELEGHATTLRLSPEQAVAGNFKPMPLGTQWGAKWEYGWFRAVIAAPTEAQGKRLVVRLDTGGESLVWINGKVMGSMGWAHNEITLTRSAKAGERFTLLFETYAGHGRITVGDGPNRSGFQTVPEPPPAQVKVGECTFGIWREEVYQLAVDFTTLCELRGRLDPLSLRVAQIDEGLDGCDHGDRLRAARRRNARDGMKAGRARLKTAAGSQERAEHAHPVSPLGTPTSTWPGCGRCRRPSARWRAR